MPIGEGIGIKGEIDTGLQQVEDCIASWIERTKNDLYNAIIDSFSKNSLKIARLAGTKQLPLLQFKGKKIGP